MKQKYVLTLLCVFTLIISSTAVYAQRQTQIVPEEKKDRLAPFTGDGVFTAEICLKDNTEPFISLAGNYQVKNTNLICKGTATINDKEGNYIEGKFSGLFKKDYYILKITVEEWEDKSFSIIGKYDLDDNKEDFHGVWFKRKDNKKEIGWIKGAFIGGAENIPTNPETYPIFKKIIERPIFRSIFLRILKTI
jgi:hypothetical protein